MKTHFLFLPLVIVALAACDRSASQRADDEKRVAELRDLEQRAAQRESDAKAAENDLERKRLADEQAAIDAEKEKLAAEKASVADDSAKLAQWQAEQQRVAQREAALKSEQQRRGAAEREAREVTREAAREPQQEAGERNIDSFYAALEPHGDWIEASPYGYCWQPREARTPGWRPYMDGTWVFTDYGWTWKANEPFGWATYHYGRWARIRGVGWVWVPGSEWAPAWVSWRHGGQYVGWAPLPPEAHSGAGFNAGVDSYYDIGPASYNFVPTARIGEPSYRGIVVEPERNVTIINQTVNITKINYTNVQNRTVIFNGGPDLAQINAVSARPIPRLRVERVAEARSGGGPGTAVVGNVLQLLAPQIRSASRPSIAPSKVRQVVKAAEVERGWTGGDATAVQAARAQIQQEAGKAEQRAQVEPVRPVRTVVAPSTAPTPDLGAAAREAQAARMAAQQKAEAERAGAATKQLEAQKKVLLEREAAMRLEESKRLAEEQKKIAAEKRAAEVKAQAAAQTTANTQRDRIPAAHKPGIAATPTPAPPPAAKIPTAPGSPKPSPTPAKAP